MMRTSWVDMWASVSSKSAGEGSGAPCADPHGSGGGAACARAGGGLRAVAARARAAFENGGEGGGDLHPGEGLVLAVPVSDPVEGAREGERGHLRIAGMDGSVLHSLADEAPDAVIDLRLQRLDVATHGRRQVLVLGARHAPAELRRHR